MGLNIEVLKINMKTCDKRAFKYTVDTKKDSEHATITYEEEDGYKEMVRVIEFMQHSVTNYIKEEKNKKEKEKVFNEYTNRVLKLIEKGHYEVFGITMKEKILEKGIKIGDGVK